MMMYLSLQDALMSNSVIENKGITFISGESEERFCSYKELYDRALKILGHLQAKGICKGNEAVFQIEDNELFIYTYWACILGGIVPVPISVGTSEYNMTKLFNIWGKLNKPYLLTDTEFFQKIKGFINKSNLEANKAGKIDDSTILLDEFNSWNTKGIVTKVESNDICFIQFSSGSTGNPKGVVLTHENLTANIKGLVKATGVKEKYSFLSWMPLTHDMGLIAMHLAPLFVASNQYIMPNKTFIRHPLLWIMKINEHRVNYTSSPNFGYKYFLKFFSQEVANQWDLSCIKTIFNGAEPISYDLCETFVNKLAEFGLKETSILPAYGLAEASVGVSFPPVGEKIKAIYIDRDCINMGQRVKECDSNSSKAVAFIDVGYSIDYCNLRIAGENNEVIDEYTVGRVQIKGKNVTSGYYNDRENTEKVITKDGWLDTGDLGFLRNGSLILTGRLKDLILVNGQNVYPHDIERVAQENETVKIGEMAVCGTFDPSLQKEIIILFALYKRPIENFINIALSIKKHVFFKAGIDITHVLPIRKIPKTTSGKIQRHKLVEDYHKGVFDSLIRDIETIISTNSSTNQSISKEETEEKLLKICGELFGENKVGANDSLLEIGGDSITLVKLHEYIEEVYPGKTKLSDLFAHPTISKLASFINGSSNSRVNGILQKEKTSSCNSNKDDDIAIIGIASNMPSAKDKEIFWDNVKNGIDCVDNFPELRRKKIDEFLGFTNKGDRGKAYLKGAYLDSVDEFDYKFFKFTPKEASLIDPAQRLFLQTSYQAIEDAGYGGNRLFGSNTGVYVGYANSIDDNYRKIICDSDPSFAQMSIISTLPAMLPTRLAYFMDFMGPTMVINTACSSTLVSVHLACQGIQNGDCDMAVAGGIKLHLAPLDEENNKIGIESTDGRTRAFDDDSHGTGIGEGVGAILLKPLKQAIKDGDNIYAVIKGSAVNQDGKSVGITAPNPEAQTELVLKAWNNGDIDPESISYILTHGTGTKLGDPIEIEGIKKAFETKTSKKQFCAIGSVKNNIGHLFEGAGIANLIVAALALKNNQIPPSIYFNKPNSRIDFENSPVYVNDKLKGWNTDTNPRRCGVSSFGFSGTNCHIILEEAPTLKKESAQEDNAPNMFVLSAKSKKALEDTLGEYLKWIRNKSQVSLSDLCFSASMGRGHYDFRVSFVVSDIKEFEEKLISILDIGLDNVGSNHIFYANQRLLTTTDTVKRTGDLSRDKLKMLVAEAEFKLNQFIETGSNNKSLLEELCSLYTVGADINWEKLYENKKVKRIQLPVYQFERNSCWISASALQSNATRLNHSKSLDMLYDISWIRKDRDNKNLDLNINNTSVVVVKGKSKIAKELCDELKQHGNEVFEIELGESYKKCDDLKYTIDATEDSFTKLFRELEKRKIRYVFHTMALDCEELESIEEFKEKLNRGATSLFNLAKAVKKEELNQGLVLTVISKQAYDVVGNEKDIKPENALLFGLARVIQAEIPNITCNCIDIDDSICIKDIISESISENKNNYCALRNGQRYVEQINEADLPEYKQSKAFIKEGGVYVITGGFGGIGLEIAAKLANINNINLVLLGRSTIPNREEWEKILTQRIDLELCRRISAVKSLEKQGAKVYCVSADVSNEKELRTALKEAKSINGKINGIIHSAGIAGRGLLASKSEREFMAVLSPKVEGTWLIDKICGDDVDFLVLFSSILSFVGFPGQSDYAAANAYLDAFTHYRNKKGRKTLTINWSAWEETGMAKEHGVNGDTFFKSVSNEDAVSAFMNALASDKQRVIVGEINPNSNIDILSDKLCIRISQEIKNKLEKYRAESFKNVRVDNPSAIDATDLDEVKKALSEIACSIMGYEEIDMNENFISLGGDSLLLVRLHKEIDKYFPDRILINDLFSYPCISLLSEYIIGNTNNKIKPIKNSEAQNKKEDIAVIGMAARFPEANDINEFWENIILGKDCISEFPEDRSRDIKGYLKKHMRNISGDGLSFYDGGYLSEIDKFDYSYFKLTPKEAMYTDPNQRIFMETAIEAVDDAGYGGKRLEMSKTGIFVGYAKTAFDYDRIISDEETSMLGRYITGNLASIIPSRIAYHLNLKGPTVVIDTACSSALVSVHTACRSIRQGECDMALAGSIKLNLIPFTRDENAKIGIESSDCRARAFDDSSDGTGIGEGVGVVVLKPLSKALADGDNIYAVLKGSAINQDGASLGLTAPNALSQAEVICSAWEDAGIEPETVRYIEAHGTGTKLGDPIEIDGLNKAFSKYTDKKQFCALASVKTNIGHLYEGAGMASLIKAIISVNKGIIPPTLHFKRPNRKISFENSPVYVNEKLSLWDSEAFPRRAGVSGFGLSGTNCHIVLEQAPVLQEYVEGIKSDINIFVLSAKSKNALINNIKALLNKKAWWYDKPIAQVCYTLCNGRGHYNNRIAFTVNNKEELISKLEIAEKSIEASLIDEKIYYSNSSAIDTLEQEEAKKNISKEINSKIAEKSCYDNDYIILLEKVCEAYVRGADIDWGRLFNSEKMSTVSLPAYSFEKNRCWLEFAVDKVNNVNIETNSSIRNSILHKVKWIKQDIQNHIKNDSPQKVLVFLDEEEHGKELITRLKDQGKEIIEVRQGNEFESLGNNGFIIGDADDDYKKLMRHLEDEISLQIIHLSTAGHSSTIATLEDLKKTQEKGIHSLFNIIKAVSEVCPEISVDIVLVSKYIDKVDGSEAEIRPYNATMFGLAKVASKEYSKLRFKCIDIDDKTKINDLVEDFYFDEEVGFTSYRNGLRYIPAFESINAARLEANQVELDSQGVYIITGGTGGIGLELAKSLASMKKINIALLNRSKIPSIDLLNDIEDIQLKTKYEKANSAIKEIQNTGSTVECISADVASIEAVQETIGLLKQKYGKINGIIHAAGISYFKLLEESDREDFERTFSAKVYGTWILEEATKNEDMEFFITTSSIATMFYGQGQAEYVAANSYLDSFAAQRSLGGRRTMAINWAQWKETGMAANEGFKFDTLFKAMETEEAVNAFNQILNNDFTGVAVGRINYESRMRKLLRKSIYELAEDVKAELKVFESKEETKIKRYQDSNKMDSQEKDNTYTPTEKVIISICEEEFGYNDMNIDANFFELGGDSILLSRVISRLGKLYPNKLTLTDAFEYSTIAKLAQYIDSSDKEIIIEEKKSKESSEEDISKMLDEMESGSLTMEEILSNLDNL